MDVAARLIPTLVPARPQGAVLVLHGGASRAAGMRVSPTQLSVLRMVPIAGLVAARGRNRLAVFRLLNSVRGWDTAHTPVDDVRWALGEVRDRLGGGVPVCLIGHSLGGRAAILSADQPDVRSVVALAPWVYPSDGSLDARGRQVLIVHGSDDRIASPQRSAAAARLLARTADVGYVTVSGGKHAMLRHHRRFDGLAAEFATATLLATPPSRGGAVEQVLSGADHVEV